MLFPSLSCNEFITHDEFLSISNSMCSSLGSFKNLLEETKQSKTKSTFNRSTFQTPKK